MYELITYYILLSSQSLSQAAPTCPLTTGHLLDKHSHLPLSHVATATSCMHLLQAILEFMCDNLKKQS